MQSMKWQPLASGQEAAPLVGKSRKSPSAAALSIDAAEAPERRIERLIAENPVVIFSRGSCCMCHVMRRLFASVGVHPTVIELEEAEEASAAGGLPAVFIGGSPVGGLEGLIGLHLSGSLVPRLREVGALWG
ncbi:putative glutaredoxin-C7 [Iris pallida]|uniref:Glutaredoxin-C7 n=1 Tax=Iris pallida TaxID=29817 RepID=A0AAX6EMD6_IRIPA|nr:putative glutaredoxin-C7 [Iris pallida]